MSSSKVRALVLWERTTHQILDTTKSFPPQVRLTFGQRIDHLALDIIEELVKAQYAGRSGARAHLQEIHQLVGRLQLLLQLAADRHYLSTGRLDILFRCINQLATQIIRWEDSLC